MDYNQVILRGYEILKEAGISQPDVTVPNFLDFSDLVRDALKAWPKKRLESTPWVLEFAESLKKLRDDFEDIVRADPLILYRPAHEVALAFHKSAALIRYFRCGNGCSKTQAGAYDNYAVVTGQMPYRAIAMPPANIFIVGTNFSKYAPAVFEKKYLEGEPGNPLSPVFPEGGAWLNHYDPRKYIITVCCKECHDKRRPKECSHTKSTIQLFSDREGPEVLAGGQYAGGQFDEEIDSSFKEEALQRFRGVPTASLMVTGTPLGGKGRWEHQQLTSVFESGGAANRVENTTRPLVSLHTIDQYAAGLEDPASITARMQLMSSEEAEARVWGRPAAYAESGVFNKFAISDMFDEVQDPLMRAELVVVHSLDTAKILPEPELLSRYDPAHMGVLPEQRDNGALKIWELPVKEEQYVIGADVAYGLCSPAKHDSHRADYSCGQVCKLVRHGLDVHLEQVACFHDYINPSNYADALYKMSIFYNNAWVVVERRGPGDNTVRRLTADLGCPNVFRDITDPSQVEWCAQSLYGVDTNVKTKGIIVSLLQKVIHDPVTKQRSMIIRDYSTIEELGQFGQEVTESGLSYRFRGVNGAKDDRVMGLAMLVYAVLTHPALYDLSEEFKRQSVKAQQMEKLSPYERQFWQDLYKEREEEEWKQQESLLD